MGGCSLIVLLILAIPLMIIGIIVLTIFSIALTFMTIGGIVTIILAIIIKIVCLVREKNGKEVKSYVKIISTIILIVGIALVLPMIFGQLYYIKHDLDVKREKQKIENLYNKVTVNDHSEWHDNYFLFNGKKVIYSHNLYLPATDFYLKKEVAGYLVYKDSDKLRDAFVILSLENFTDYPMFLIESIEYESDPFKRLNSGEIHIYEEDENKIREYYRNSDNQTATIHYVNDRSEYKTINSDFNLSDLINLEKHYDDYGYVSLSEESIIQTYFFVIQSKDEFYTDYIAIVETEEDYYLVDNKDHIAISSIRSSENTIYLDLFNQKRNKIVRNLTLEEKEYIKKLINKAVEE